jgi:hypothetical protein
MAACGMRARIDMSLLLQSCAELRFAVLCRVVVYVPLRLCYLILSCVVFVRVRPRLYTVYTILFDMLRFSRRLYTGPTVGRDVDTKEQNLSCILCFQEWHFLTKGSGVGVHTSMSHRS